MNRSSLLVTKDLQLQIATRLLFKNLNLSLKPGQCWGLLGRNGSGKTALLHTLAGLRHPTKGEVLLEGVKLAQWQRRALAQKLGLFLQHRPTPFIATVETIVLAGRYPHLGPWRAPGVKDKDIAAAALVQVSLQGLEQRLITTLSGGEQQRVYLAALLAQEPKILLLDEPVAHLDLAEQYRLLRLLRRLADQGHAIIVSLHDLNQALFVCDHLLLLHRSRVLAGPISQLGTTRLLSRVFGTSLVRMDGPTGTLLVPC